MATIAILGTMDTKGEEHGFVADRIKQRGHQVLVIDVGALGAPRLNPDITRREVAAAADVDFDALAAKRDRGETVAAMSKGAPVVLSRLVAEKKIHGVIPRNETTRNPFFCPATIRSLILSQLRNEF